MPEAVLVVENVVLEAAGGRRAESLDEMRHPAGLQGRAVQDVRVERVIARHRLTCLHSVAGLREPLPVAIVLGAVHAAVETRELRPVGPDLRDVLNDGDRHHRFGAAGTAGEDEVVAALSRRGARFRNALEIPVGAAVVRVQLPVVTRRVVAAVTMQRRIQVL